MHLAPDLPELDHAEAERHWMTPEETCAVAGIGKGGDATDKKFLANISDRELVGFVKTGDSRTSPRAYSLVSAVGARVIWQMTRQPGRTFEAAAGLATTAGTILRNLVGTYSELEGMPNRGNVFLYRIEQPPHIEFWRVSRDAISLSDLARLGPDIGVLQVGMIIAEIVETYAGMLAFKRRGGTTGRKTAAMPEDRGWSSYAPDASWLTPGAAALADAVLTDEWAAEAAQRWADDEWTHDDDGRRVLVGMNAEETEFYTNYVKTMDDGFKTSEETARYLALNEKHRIAHAAISHRRHHPGRRLDI